ncbi:MAG: PD-(D/E)XK nuclease family protein, partial [bacterium]
MELSYSRISTFKRCFKKYQYRYVKGLRKKEQAAPPRMGSMGHRALEEKLKGNDWKKAIIDYWREEMNGIPEQFIDEESKEEIELVTKVVERYFKKYGFFRSEDEFDLIEPEKKFKVKIPTTDNYLIGYMDRVIKVPNEGIWLVDHKFTTQDPKNKIKHLELNEQIDYYIWAMSKQFPEETILGAIWNAIKLDLPTVPKPIKSGKRLTKRKMATDYETYYQAILDNGFDPKDYEDYLYKLKHQDDKFFQREWIERDSYELKQIENELINLSNIIGNVNLDIRSRNMGQCYWDCPYEQLCLVEKKGGD